MNISTFFSLKDWQFNDKLGSLPAPTSILCLKDYPHNLTEYEIKGPRLFESLKFGNGSRISDKKLVILEFK